MTDRQITHAPGCWGWGPRHYECAVREIELLVAEWKRVAAARGEAEARAERLAEALRWIASDDTAKGCDDGMQEVEAIKQRAHAALTKEDRND